MINITDYRECKRSINFFCMNLDCIYIQHLGCYIFWAVFIAVIIRICISWMKVLEYCYYPKNKPYSEEMKLLTSLKLFKRFFIILAGFSKKDPVPDFWYNTLLGIVELIVFPIFMKAHQYTMIGAWIGFKSVAQWTAWNRNRFVFNRFLLAHAAIVIISWHLMSYVTVYP